MGEGEKTKATTGGEKPIIYHARSEKTRKKQRGWRHRRTYRRTYRQTQKKAKESVIVVRKAATHEIRAPRKGCNDLDKTSTLTVTHCNV